MFWVFQVSRLALEIWRQLNETLKTWKFLRGCRSAGCATRWKAPRRIWKRKLERQTNWWGRREQRNSLLDGIKGQAVDAGVSERLKASPGARATPTDLFFSLTEHSKLGQLPSSLWTLFSRALPSRVSIVQLKHLQHVTQHVTSFDWVTSDQTPLEVKLHYWHGIIKKQTFDQNDKLILFSK